jgi:uncharacterized membrane protein
MSDAPQPPEPMRPSVSLRTARLEAFSDGVFAIAITLLVLEIAVPLVTEPHVGRALLHQWPVYTAYLVSFATIGSAWLGHTVITEYLERADSILLRLNLLLLFFVSLLPFPTSMLSAYIRHADAERIATVAYGLNLLAISGLLSVMWHYSVSEGLVHPATGDVELRMLTAKLDPSLALYAIAIGTGVLFPRVAFFLYLAIALLGFIPLQAITGWMRRHR